MSLQERTLVRQITPAPPAIVEVILVDATALVEAFAQHLTRRGQSPVTVRNRVGYARRLVADLDPLTVAPFPLEEWVFSQGWKPESINGAITGARKFFQWLKAAGYRDDDPSTDMKTVRVPFTRARIADDEAILRALARSRNASTRLMLLLAAECGLRRAEIAHVHRDDICGRQLRVHGKGNRERFIHLSDHLLELLDRMPAEGWIFPGGQASTEPITGDGVYKRLRRVLGGNPHSLRHRAATAVYHGTGNDIRVTQEFLGHASPQMTAKYVHVSENDLRRASEAASLFNIGRASA